MNPATVKEFLEQLKLSLSKITPQLILQVTELNPHRFKGRVTLSSERFIDIFYSPEKERIAFALIEKNERIWGIDNLGGWHFHPLWNEKEHVKAEYTSVEQIVKQFKTVIEKLKAR